MSIQGINEALKNAISIGEKSEASSSQISDFSQMVSNSIDSVIENQKTAETLSIQAMNDSSSVDMQELITAVSQAELTLQTMVSVRDKAVEAYNKIMDMPL